MKKIFTLLMALCLVAGMNASKFSKIDRQLTKKALTTERLEQTRVKALRAIAPVAPAQKAARVADAQPLPFEVAKADAIFLGTYFYNFYQVYLIDWTITLSNAEENKYLSLDIMPEKEAAIAGTYELDEYSDLVLINAPGDTTEYACTGGSVTIEYVSTGDGNYTYRIYGEYQYESGSFAFDETQTFAPYDLFLQMYCEQLHEYCDEVDIVMIDAPAEPITDLEEIEMIETTVLDYRNGDWNSLDYMMHNGEDADPAYSAYISVIGAEQAGTFKTADFDFDYVNLYLDENKVILLDSAFGTVTALDEGGFKYEFHLFGRYDGYEYKISGTCAEPVDPYFQYDEKEEEFDEAYDESDNVQLIDNTANYYIDLYMENSSSAVELWFIATELAPGNRIPVGVHTITSEVAIGNVYASQGYSSSEGVTPSYAMTFADNMIQSMWCMQSGTVTVSYNEEAQTMSIVVEAINSNGVAVKAAYNGSIIVPTGLEEVIATNVADKAVKFIENGQLLIVRDGKAYNILGARVK